MKRIVTDSTVLLFEEIIVKAINFIALMIIARFISKDSFGILVTAGAITNYSITVASMGMQNFGVILSATSRDKRKFSIQELFSSRLIWAITVFVASSLIIILLPLPIPIRLLFLLYQTNVILDALNSDWYLRGKKRFITVAKLRIFGALLYLLLLVPLFQYQNILVVALALITSLFMQSVITFRLCDDIKLKFTTIENAKKVLLYVTPLGLGGVVHQIPLFLIPLVLTLFWGSSETANYGAAFKIMALIRVLDPVVTNIYLSSFPGLWERDREEAQQKLSLLLWGVTMLVSVIVVVFAFGGDRIASFIFGDQYTDLSLLLSLLGIFVLFTIVNSVVSLGLVVVSTNKDYFKASSLGIATSLVVIPIFIKLWGALGAVLVLGLSELLVTLFSYRYFRRKLKLPIFPIIIMQMIFYFSIYHWYFR